jgi:hypothetical protein
MGTLKRGILGGFSGKVGNIVGSSWKGIAVIKTLPLSVANPRTTAQTNQRSDFKAVAIFASLILAGYIKPLWDRFASGMSGYNAFMQKNVPLYDRDTAPHVQDFVMSVGKMQATPILTTEVVNSSHTASCTYAPTLTGPLMASTDLAYGVAVSAEDGSVAVSSGEATRDTEQVDFTFDDSADLSGDVYFFLSFKRADGTIVSGSSTASGAE